MSIPGEPPRPAVAPAKPACALLTPEGRAAVASIAVWGRGASEAVAPLFDAASARSLTGAPAGRVLFGRWRASGEEVVVCCVDQQQVEIHCHGGAQAAEAILRELQTAGVARLPASAWLADHEREPLTRQARAAIPAALTRRAAAILLDQYAGALAAAVDACRRALQQSAAARAAQLLDALLEGAVAGCHLTRPFQVYLIGPPNVGKSSLMNALAGFDRALVFDRPGTTRDLVRQTTALDGWPVELIDTAGWHSGAERLEQSGIARAREALGEADLICLVSSCEVPLDRDGGALLAELRGAFRCPILRVTNKVDLASGHRGELPHRGESSETMGRDVAELHQLHELAVATSALTGQGIAALEAAIVRTLVPRVPAAGQAVPFLPHHVAHLQAARDAAGRGDLPAALAALGRLAAPAFDEPA